MADKDAFERAVERERVLSERAERFYSPDAQMKLVQRFFWVLLVGWGALLVAHWIWLGDPHWLVVLHTLVFAVYGGGMIAASSFVSFMRRRRERYLRT